MTQNPKQLQLVALFEERRNRAALRKARPRVRSGTRAKAA